MLFVKRNWKAEGDEMRRCVKSWNECEPGKEFSDRTATLFSGACIWIISPFGLLHKHHHHQIDSGSRFNLRLTRPTAKVKLCQENVRS